MSDYCERCGCVKVIVRIGDGETKICNDPQYVDITEMIDGIQVAYDDDEREGEYA